MLVSVEALGLDGIALYAIVFPSQSPVAPARVWDVHEKLRAKC